MKQFCKFLDMKGMKKSLLILLLLPMTAFAEVDSGDTAWLLTSTALVLFMTIPGLSLFYAGMVRSKNVLSVLMQCFSITAIASIIWVLFGYSLSFSDGGSWNAIIGGLDNFLLAEVTRDSMSGTIPESVFVMFQMTFAIITPALIVGGFAERMRFPAIVLFTILWLFVVYFPIAHQVWGGGWLAEYGVLDFAGGLVVHLTAGCSALVAALVLRPRLGFSTGNLLPHNLTLTITGAGMLWVGWFGFNAGSAVAANSDAGMAMLVTHISAAAAAFVWMAIEWIKYGKPGTLGIVTGMVAGLGTITPASGFVGPLGALIIGISAGALCYTLTYMIKQVWKIDDSLDVFSVHAVGGMLGTILLSIFIASSYGGAGYPDGMDMSSQLMVQIVGVLYVLVWTAVATFIVLKVVSMFTALRVNEEDENKGLDIADHEERGYIL